jgi:EAL domain-containing protein (putative c-di-GMP-specific phosphodiesterase class I)
MHAAAARERTHALQSRGRSGDREIQVLIDKTLGDEVCGLCESAPPLDFEISMAFQPIVEAKQRRVFGYEALVRGPQGEGADWVFERVNDDNRYRFDQTCRVRAVQLASALGLEGYLSINFMPNAVYDPARCIRTTLKAAETFDFPVDRIMFEVTEGERVDDVPRLREIIAYYQQRGFLTAIDDFGAGFAGLGLLAELQTDLIKLDMALIRNIDADRVKRSILSGSLQTCKELGMRVIAEGVETTAELETLEGLGVELFQGFLFARPGFEALPDVAWPDAR